MKFRIACTIRHYISQLRCLRGTLPGRLEDQVVDGLLFEHEFRSIGHFQKRREMISMTRWCSTAAHLKNVGMLHKLLPQPVVGEEWDLVFSHGDLNLTNLLLSKNGVLWVLDWRESGFYPW